MTNVAIKMLNRFVPHLYSPAQNILINTNVGFRYTWLLESWATDPLENSTLYLKNNINETFKPLLFIRSIRNIHFEYSDDLLECSYQNILMRSLGMASIN